MRRAMRALGVLAVASCLPAARGSAAEPEGVAVVAVAPPPGPDRALLATTDRLRGRIADLAPGTLGVAQLRARAGDAGPGGEVAELERAFDQARRAYLHGQFEESLAALRRVAEALERVPEAPEVLGLWTRVMVRLARTELDLGHPEAARASLERLLRAVPDLAVDPALVSPRLLEELERAQGALRAEPTGALAIGSSSPGARLWVNGRAVGVAPLRLTLPRGRWRVSGQTPTARVGPLEVEVGEQPRELVLDFTAADALRPWAGQGLAAAAAERPGLLLRAGAHLGVGRVVAVARVEDLGSTYLVASVHDVGRRVLEREGRLRLEAGELPPGGDAALAEFVVSGRTDSPLVQVPGAPRAGPSLAAAPPPAPGPPLGAPDPAARQALRWSPVATAIAALAFTTGALIELRAAEDAYDRARRLRGSQGVGSVTTATTYNGLVADGDAAKGRAALYWVGAGLTAAATVGLGYLGYRRTGELGPVRF